MKFIDVAGASIAFELIKKFDDIANVVVICYKMSNYESYRAVEEWVEAHNENERGRDLPIALIATHSDGNRAVA